MMANLRSHFLRAASRIEQRYDGFKYRLQLRFDLLTPVQIVPYLGYGTRDKVHLCGRVLKDRGVTDAQAGDSVWRNMLNMYRRFASREIRFPRVQACFGGCVEAFEGDAEGYFEVCIEPRLPLPRHQVWHEIELQLLQPQFARQGAVRATGQVIVPPTDAEFGIVSDLDDTVIRTGVLNRLRMARYVLAKNAYTRRPFAGVAAFYRALQGGMSNTFNPVFYVSSTSWNFYDLLVDFFEIRGIPRGALFLADWGLSAEHLFAPSHHDHKFSRIQQLLETHPALPFILIGDSGQQDPEIYLHIAEAYPKRIAAIYLRDVTPHKRDAAVRGLTARAARAGTEMLLVRHTMEAAEHAAQRGFIPGAALAEIRREQEASS